MSDPIGSLCIVLHGHLPYVLRHGSEPHGEVWLYEAAAEVYLPLLDLIGEIALHKGKPWLTLGLTPVLLEQLAHEHFKTGFVAYLAERARRAAADRAEFERDGEAHNAELAERWENQYAKLAQQFERIKRDIPGEFAARSREGHIQILTSAATHAYLPLLLEDASIRAQLAAGASASERVLGLEPWALRGIWLPECGYRPATGDWRPAVLDGEPRRRAGLETHLAAAGLTHFFIDTHMIASAEPLGVMREGNFDAIGEAQLHWDSHRGWRNPLEPVGIASVPRAADCFAFARHPGVSEQVWSGAVGYPGSGEYLEFHRRRGEGGLRYHRITSIATPLGDKSPYDPAGTFGKLYEHSQHFCTLVRESLRAHHAATGRAGVCVACFDAELFGHWWSEGPSFLRNVLLNLNRDPEVQLRTAAGVLDQATPEMVVRLREGSWGEGGGHAVWLNDQTRWMWETEYRAERGFLKHLHALPWQTKFSVRAMLERAGRELLLLQSSDWPFVVHSKGAVDYGMKRFALHSTRFDRALSLAAAAASGRALSAAEKTEVAEMDAHDDIFAEIDLSWWR